MVWSLLVMALRKVFSDPCERMSNGLLTGKFSEPFSTECSMMCGMPVSSGGGVRKPAQKTLLSSRLTIFSKRAPLLSWRNRKPSPSSSGMNCRRSSVKPCRVWPTAGPGSAFFSAPTAGRAAQASAMMTNASIVLFMDPPLIMKRLSVGPGHGPGRRLSVMAHRHPGRRAGQRGEDATAAARVISAARGRAGASPPAPRSPRRRCRSPAAWR